MLGYRIEKLTRTTTYNMHIPHAHTNYEIFFLIDGSRTLNIENTILSLEKNCLVIIPPKVLHRTYGSAHTRYVINIDNSYLNEFEQDILTLGEMSAVSLSPEESFNLSKQFENLIQLENSTDTYKEYSQNLCLSYIIYSMSQLKNFPTTKLDARTRYKLRTKQIIDYIKSNYSKVITIETLSKTFFVSPTTLSVSFKKDTGTSVIDFLLKTRLNEAMRLLIYTKDKIETISYKCGFSSQNYFCLIFKKHIKLSPNAFRKLSQETPNSFIM